MSYKHEVIATRYTFDGVRVDVWSDGAITIGHEANNRIVARALPRDVAIVIADDVCMYDASEVRALVKSARRASSKRVPSGWIGGWNGDSELRRLTRVFASFAIRGAS